MNEKVYEKSFDGFFEVIFI